jgi:hypothetical protein
MVNAQFSRSRKRIRRNLGFSDALTRARLDPDGPYSDRNGYLWVQPQKGPNEFLPRVLARNLTTAHTPGQYVLLGEEEGELAIIKTDFAAITASGGDPMQENSQNPDASGWIQKGRFVELLPMPLSPPATETFVGPGFVQGRRFNGAITTTLDTAITALSANEQQLVGVFILPDLSIETTLSTAISTADPVPGLAAIAEVMAAASPGAMPIAGWLITDSTTELSNDALLYDFRQMVVPQWAYSEADVSSPPTDAELDAALGTPADLPPGWMAVINDAGGESASYLVWTTGGSWFYAAGTKAT